MSCVLKICLPSYFFLLLLMSHKWHEKPEFEVLIEHKCVGADAKPLGRQVALFTAVLGLVERLRSVFVPYFRYLVDSIAAHLGGSAVEAEGHIRKKKKKSTAGVLAVADESSTEPGVVEDTWRLRFKVCCSTENTATS